jgi:putative toxin-antitoxin system antitoxin component (TIGR02293 family)
VGKLIQTERIVEVLGGTNTLGRQIRSLEELERTVAEGFPKRALRHVVERVYTERKEARRALYRVVPEATYKRRVRLSPQESGRTERLARVIASAEYAWNSQADAREWLMRSHPELGGKAPMEAASTGLGARQVEEILDRLFYGIPA